MADRFGRMLWNSLVNTINSAIENAQGDIEGDYALLPEPRDHSKALRRSEARAVQEKMQNLRLNPPPPQPLTRLGTKLVFGNLDTVDFHNLGYWVFQPRKYSRADGGILSLHLGSDLYIPLKLWFDFMNAAGYTSEYAYDAIFNGNDISGHWPYLQAYLDAHWVGPDAVFAEYRIDANSNGFAITGGPPPPSVVDPGDRPGERVGPPLGL